MSTEETNEYVYIWTIKNYSACYQNTSECIESPSFTVDSLRGCLWHLLFYPKGNAEDEYVSCYLKWTKSGEIIETPSVDFSIEVIVGKNIVSLCRQGRHVFTEEECDWGWGYFIDIRELTKESNLWEEDVLTLRCKIKCDTIRKPTILRTEACTVIDVDRRCFEWNVIAPTTMEFSESMFFSISDFHSLEITIRTMSKVLKLLIRLKERDETLIRPMMFKVTFCNKEGRKIVSKHAKHLFEDAKKWEFPDFVSKNALEACSHNLNNYEFRLKCDIYISKKQILFNRIINQHFSSYTAPTVAAESKAFSETTMQKDFRSLFVNKKYFDVTVRIGNDEFPVHKLVLRVRSPVFEAMFDQNMLESETGIVNVTDVDGKTMKALLEFLYTETVDAMDYESAKKLLLAADKYQVPSLVEVCASFLRSALSVENACEIAAIADAVNCEGLKSYAFDLITLNASNILNTPNWKLWIRENIELATEILAKLSKELIQK